MTNQTPLMKSNFARRAGDHYPTVDTRCQDGLLHFFPLPITGTRLFGNAILTGTQIVDVCADQGSAIVDDLRLRGYDAHGVGDAFCSDEDLKRSAGGNVDWIITNTPYELSKVDKIIWRQIERVEKREVEAAAFLLRSTFDHAAKREEMFDHPIYAGQIKLCFRPWWTESRDKSPFHNYVWQIFRCPSRLTDPFVFRYYAPYEKRYAADVHKYKCRECGMKSRIKYTSQDKVGVCFYCLDPEYSLEKK